MSHKRDETIVTSFKRTIKLKENQLYLMFLMTYREDQTTLKSQFKTIV